jgi:hypothetical protein
MDGAVSIIQTTLQGKSMRPSILLFSLGLLVLSLLGFFTCLHYALEIQYTMQHFVGHFASQLAFNVAVIGFFIGTLAGSFIAMGARNRS